jgi:O-antigen/teichoic acid export membrane protein
MVQESEAGTPMSDTVTATAAPEAAPPEQQPGAPKAEATGVTIAKNYGWMSLDTVVSMAATLFSSVLVARSLGPDRMGEFNFVITFASVLKMLTEIAIPATVRKFAAEFMGRGDFVLLKSFINRSFRVQVMLASLGVAIGLVVVHFTFSPAQRAVATVAVLTVLPGLFLAIPTGALLATEDLRYNVLASLMATVVNVTGVTLAIVLHGGLVWLVGALLASRSFDCVVRFLMYRSVYAKIPGQARKGPLEPELRKRLIHFAGRQMVLMALYTLLFDRMEVFFLKARAPSREIAFFSVPFTLVQYLLQVPQMLAGSAAASIMVRQGRSPKEAARLAVTTTWFTMLLAAPELFGVASIADPLLRLMYGYKYLGAIPVLSTLSLFGLCLAMSQPAQYLMVAAERQISYILCMGAAAVVDVTLVYFLVPHFGAVGAAWGKGISQTVAAAGSIGVMLWYSRVPLPLGRMARVLAASTAMFFAVRAVGRVLPPLAVLLVGIPVGAAVFIVLARLLRCLDRADRERFRQLERLVPGRARGPYMKLINFLVPATSP